jgi:hypothetical protein
MAGAGKLAASIAALALLGSCQLVPQLPAGYHAASSREPGVWIAESRGDEITRWYSDLLVTKRKGIVILGSGWCHDSVALVDFFNSSASENIRNRYAIIFVDVGAPQYKRAENRALAKRYRLDPMRNTPALVVVDSNGNALNSLDDARSWKNAASRSSDDIVSYFQ